MKKFKLMLVVLTTVALIVSMMACDGAQKDAEDALYVEYKGVKIVMGAEADEIIDALGEPIDCNEMGDCGGLGAQVLYSYPSLDIYVLESKNGNTIDEISFRDDIVTTPDGVYIGMDVDDAKDALGEPDSEDDRQLEYTKGDFSLIVTYSEGLVNGIYYAS